MFKAFEGREIIEITIITGHGVRTYIKGREGIDHFEDCGIEAENGQVYVCYRGINKNGKVVQTIENCPVAITYAEVDNG